MNTKADFRRLWQGNQEALKAPNHTSKRSN